MIWIICFFQLLPHLEDHSALLWASGKMLVQQVGNTKDTNWWFSFFFFCFGREGSVLLKRSLLKKPKLSTSQSLWNWHRETS